MKRRALWIGTAVVGAFLLLQAAVRTFSGSEGEVSTALAREGPFDLTIVETGAIQAL